MENMEKLRANIILIGFMGAGKTTVSGYLSKMLGIERIELDELIAEKEGMSIASIFKNYGEEYFRNCESSILIQLQHKNNLVVSCGGGIVLRDENIINMKRLGYVVLLTATPETTYERVKDSTERPILNNNMNIEFIAGLMERRKDKYLRAADIVVSTDNKGIPEICEEIIRRLKATG